MKKKTATKKKTSTKKKTVAAKPKATTKKKTAPRKAPATKKKASPKKASPKKAPAKAKTSQPSAIEKEVAALLDDYDNGNVDNAWDVLPRMAEIDKVLPKASTLRKDFNKMLGDIEKICRES